MPLTATLLAAAKHRLRVSWRDAVASACTTTLLLVAAAPLSATAIAQQRTLRDQLIGAWTYVTVDAVRPDGTRTPMFGPHPQGIVIFDASGRYALINARSGLSKFASNNRTEGSPEEYKAVVQGSIAHFGSYTVNDADKTITFHIETSTFPNWNGVEQKRPFTLIGDELRWTTPTASVGGSGEIVLKRAN
jgi:lipocalin-like protein